MISSACCDCAAQTVFAYLRQLHQIGIKPLDSDIHKRSVRDVLDRLGSFSESNMGIEHLLMHYCAVCSLSWQRVVDNARLHTENYFEGLCLDCMRNYQSENTQYWTLETTRSDYDLSCRVGHGQATWYFSFKACHEQVP
jgi:hypothetical protein